MFLGYSEILRAAGTMIRLVDNAGEGTKSTGKKWIVEWVNMV